jgi:glycosyltransferase involved in cell wall biosynthesis
MSERVPEIGLYSNQFHARKKRGVGTYAYQLTRHLLQQLTEPRIALIDCVFRSADRAHMPQFDSPNVEERIIPIPGRLFEASTRYLNWSLLNSFTGRLDLLHAMQEQVPVCRSGPAVMTVHDLGPVLHPDLFDAQFARRWRFFLDQGLERAARIVAVSETLADELRAYRPDLAEKFVGTPLGISSAFLAAEDADRERSVLESHSVPSPYILLVGAADPKKNLDRFMGAYILFHQRRSGDVPHLVLVGKEAWGGFESIREAIDQSGIRSHIHFTGYIDQSDLPGLYRNASLFVFPSRFEGFGLPLVEAMTSGAACLVSDIPVFHELGGNCVEYFDPLSHEEMAVRLDEVLHDSDRLTNMRECSRERGRSYVWEETARRTIQVYEDLLGTSLR